MEVPFKLSLMPYGYTFIGKGTTDRGWEKTKQKAEVYHILQPVQGSAVPVFLDSIHLSQTYFYKGAKIKHFLLLSWCGDEFDWVNWNQEQWNVYRQMVRKIRRFGIHPGEVRRSDVLWDPQRRQARLDGLDQARLVPKRHGARPNMKRSQTALAALNGSPMKRVKRVRAA
jgi:hypothetical protein